MPAMTNFCQELQRIVQHKLLQPLFQPIVSMQTQQIIGYEALIRGPSDSPLHSPVKLFESACHCQMLESLEMLCRDISISEYSRQQGRGLLFFKRESIVVIAIRSSERINVGAASEIRLRSVASGD